MNAESIITDYQSSLRAFLKSRMRTAADVDDVLQDALTKAFQNLHTLKTEDKIKPWLFQIARNAMMDHYRHKSRDAAVTANDLWYDQHEENTEHAFEGCVEPFLLALPAEVSDLLRAVELQGMSQQEYAERLGTNYSTLKSRVRAGRKQLRNFSANAVILLSRLMAQS